MQTPRINASSHAFPALVALLTLLGWSSSAFTHTHLEKSVPANGSVLSTAPENFVLTFAEPARLTALSLQKGSETPQKLTPLPSAAAKEMSIPAPRLTPGKYVLSWRVVSDDGHVMPGKLSFTITGQ
ncbi:MAG TPA: copper resistance CopC family protein [Steroidobacteraceae bacterium]|nr:copper resistance CopC family protein [Steroidobacteraceae bacterium]